MRIRVLPMALAITAVVLLAGCSGTASDQAPQADMGAVSVEGGAPMPAGEMAAGDTTAVDKAAVGTASTVQTDRQVIKTAFVSMRAENVTKTAFDVHGLVAKRNGLISSENTQATGDSQYSTITAQIPAADLDAFIADVSALGTVDSINVSAQDVTSQVVDLDARIKALQTSVDRMTQLLAQAERIEDLLAIETQLSQRQAELDALTAQRKYLAEQVAMSTVTVNISPETEITSVDAPGFLSGLESGWAAFVSVIMVAITALGFLLPFLVILLLIAVPLVLLVVRQARRHRRSLPPPPAAVSDQEAGTSSTT